MYPYLYTKINVSQEHGLKNPTDLPFVRILYIAQHHVCKEIAYVYVCLCIKYLWKKTQVADNRGCLWELGGGV